VNTSEFKNNKAQIEDLFEKLRKKLNSFDVINLSGQTIGRIKDFTLDKNRRLYMVIPQASNQSDSPVILLSSKYIQNVDPSNRAVFVKISQAELNSLPLYQHSNNTEFSRQSSTSPQQENTTNFGAREDIDESPIIKEQSLAAQNFQETNNPPAGKSGDFSEVGEGEMIRLLEERVIVNRSKHKIGEVVVRKQIETRFVEVPVKREKLIVERIGSETQQPVEVEQLPSEYFSSEGEVAQSGDSLIPNHAHSSPTQSYTTEKYQDVDNESFTDEDSSQVVEEELVRLLEERLVISRQKWKVGEVIVRKEIETETVQVPIRREKLIVEQVGLETKIVAEIDLAKGEVTSVELTDVSRSSTPQSGANYHNPNTVVGEFISPKAASNLLDAIALQKHHGCTKVRIELVVESPELQETYQKMFDRCSTR
jgi:stress response protein YsnF